MANPVTPIRSPESTARRTPEPTHTALVAREIWDAAQQMGRRHGSTRDPETPTTRPGRRYPLRSRLFCAICHRRMAGQGRTTTAGQLTYYRCPHDPAIPRHVAAYPEHRNVWVREEPLMTAVAGFFTDRVFGPDRAAMLDATVPRTAAAQAARAGMLRKKLAKIDVSETALISELEQTPEGMPEAAVAAYRQRLRARFTELYIERTTLQTQLDTLITPSDEPTSDPALMDELPFLGDIVTNAPPGLIERLLAIFDLSAVYNRDKHQLTIHATITPTTPQAIRDLLTDPRATTRRCQTPALPGRIRFPIRPGQLGHPPGRHCNRSTNEFSGVVRHTVTRRGKHRSRGIADKGPAALRSGQIFCLVLLIQVGIEKGM